MIAESSHRYFAFLFLEIIRILELLQYIWKLLILIFVWLLSIVLGMYPADEFIYPGLVLLPLFDKWLYHHF